MICIKTNFGCKKNVRILLSSKYTKKINELHTVYKLVKFPHHQIFKSLQFYMVLIEDVVQVILGSSYLADSSRWFYEFRENGSLTANSDCIGSFLKANFACHFPIHWCLSVRPSLFAP